MIYLDNAATSMPKPKSVIQAMSRAAQQLASPGRGSSKASEEAEQLLYDLRMEAAEQFDCAPEQVVLTTSATHGLNIAIKSLVSKGDRVVVSGMEHNAVMRPLYALGANVQVARGALFDDAAFLTELAHQLTVDTRLCVMTHVSNVFGWILPVEQAAELCRKRGIPFVLDASQSAGVLPVKLRGLGAAFVAMPGHKGLMGPQGTGLLLCGHEAKPLLEGGTGSISRSFEMPEFLPDRLEPGTHNMPGAAGLLAGMRHVRRLGIETICQREQRAKKSLERELHRFPNIRVYRSDNQTGVLSFVPENMDCVILAEALGKQGIAVRAGLHCAPLAHETAGTLETGTLRLSPGPSATEQELSQFGRVLNSLMQRRSMEM